jgi:hypothetical protein
MFVRVAFTAVLYLDRHDSRFAQLHAQPQSAPAGTSACGTYLSWCIQVAFTGAIYVDMHPVRCAQLHTQPQSAPADALATRLAVLVKCSSRFPLHSGRSGQSPGLPGPGLVENRVQSGQGLLED